MFGTPGHIEDKRPIVTIRDGIPLRVMPTARDWIGISGTEEIDRDHGDERNDNDADDDRRGDGFPSFATHLDEASQPERGNVLVVAFPVVVLIVSGVLVIGLGWLGRVGKLPRNRWAGIRLPSTMRRDAAWVAAHRATWAETAAVGAISIAWGCWIWLDATAVAVSAWVMSGSLLVVLIIATVHAHRVAKATNENETSS